MCVFVKAPVFVCGVFETIVCFFVRCFIECVFGNIYGCVCVIFVCTCVVCVVWLCVCECVCVCGVSV